MNKLLVMLFLLITLLLLGCYKFDYSQNTQNNPEESYSLAKYLYKKGLVNEIKFENEYKDKLIYISGRIKHIKQSGEVEFTQFNGRTLFCNFNKKDQLSNLNGYDRIIFSGYVSHIVNKTTNFSSKKGVYFKNCDILEYVQGGFWGKKK